jgi:hypothetical protein
MSEPICMKHGMYKGESVKRQQMEVNVMDV